ncbi:24102_t:CDS:1, partial [Gigaspora rosea]
SHKLSEEDINIIARDINTNLNPEKIHISQASLQRDPSREILANKIAKLHNVMDFAKE